MITLEQVDQLRKRTNCSYEEAKELLEKHNGDILEAIVDFEKNRKGKSFGTGSRSSSDFWKKVREVIRLGFDNRIVVEDSKGIMLNIPVNIIILLIIFVPFVMIPVFILLLFLGYKISIRKVEGTEYNISAMFKDVTDKFAKSNQCQQPVQQEMQKAEQTTEKDDYNEITIE